MSVRSIGEVEPNQKIYFLQIEEGSKILETAVRKEIKSSPDRLGVFLRKFKSP